MYCAASGNEENPREYLDSLVLHGIKLGLQNITEIMNACGRPQLAYPVVHVGGTNGKGSVVTFLGSILKAAGYRAGCFTSPHLLDVTERFMIDKMPMDEDELRENTFYLKSIAEKVECAPTFFEMNTAIAFRWFARRQVDIALVEVGMGGRYDSTNIIEPLFCAITNIDYDHTQYLGNTLEKIAYEKSGILKINTPAVLGPIGTQALRVIGQEADKRGAPLFYPGHGYEYRASGTTWHPVLEYGGFGVELNQCQLGMPGSHQVHNAAISVSLALLLRGTFPRVTEETIREGLCVARWPGRLERVLEDPPVIMDVAHNPAGCAALEKCLDKCVTIFAVSSDKDAVAMVKHLANFSAPLILTTYKGTRTMSLETLRRCAGDAPFMVIPEMADALEKGMSLAGREKPLLVTGSIYAAGEARRILIERYGAKKVEFD
jgi:dihydrofolate synthase / folylpolyglutamate synthase